MEDWINKLKDKVYEVEGLLELLHQRHDKKSELAPMIESRLEEALKYAKGLPHTTDSDAQLEEAESTIQEHIEPLINPGSEVTTNAKPAFCLGDKFRFKKALFADNDADFNAAMDIVASLDDYEEAEEYFLAELGFDSENQDVKHFMKIIKEYFYK